MSTSGFKTTPSYPELPALSRLLTEGSYRLGFALSKKQLSSFLSFSGLLHKWGKRMNLTALLSDKQGLVEELFLDSLAPLMIINESHLKEPLLLDVGSGCGVPGIPLKIIRPGLKIVMSDSRQKKVIFMRQAIRELSLDKIEARQLVFSANGASGLETDFFDFVVSKAAAHIERLLPWAAPHLKEGGRLICMMGVKSGGDPRFSGFSLTGRLSYQLPLSGIKRELFVYRKDHVPRGT